ncbi:MAG: NeuD/PglB/VioB family sugar acetyltransferase [Bacteroidales bacterium]|nr:NeuD/PglB/VioB family sugar acetyltransferase [Bacteroidales bacterium]
MNRLLCNSFGRQLCIIGTGGCARETYSYIKDIFLSQKEDITDKVVFLDKDELVKDGMQIMDCRVIKESGFDRDKYVVVLAIGDSRIREKVFAKYKGCDFATVIHPTAMISEYSKVGNGSIVAPNCVIGPNVEIGDFAHINIQTNIGHDCRIKDFFTTAYSVNISGACNIGNTVYFGTNSCIKQGITVCDKVIIGMGASVVKNITVCGTYIGCPAKLLINKNTP